MTRLQDEGMTPDQLRTRSAHVRGMLDHAGWTVYMNSLQRTANELERKILKGDLSIEDYLRHTGQLRGIEQALELPAKLTGKSQEGPDSE